MSYTAEMFTAVLCCPVCASPQDVVTKGDRGEKQEFECGTCGSWWACVVTKHRVEEFGHG